MSTIRPTSVANVAKVGSPRLQLGTLFVDLRGGQGGIPSSVVVPSPNAGNIYLGGLGVSNDQHAFGIPALYPTSTVNEIHSQIEYQVPQFIQDDHREFLSFMKEYYKHSEKAGGPLYFLRRLLVVQDIDRTVDELLEYFYREYAPSFPRDVSLSPEIIIKSIRQFYKAKGSENSFRFLFRVLFDQEIEFYYPRLDILRFSDAKWIQYRTIKCVLLSGSASQLANNRIIGKKSRASAFVERVLLVQDGSITSYELFLNRSSITGEFEADEIVRNEADDCNLRIMPMVSKIQVTVKGAGYKTGQEVLVTGEGFSCKAKITSVGNIGDIESVEVYNLGGGYRPDTTSVTFPVYSGVTQQAYGKVIFNVITKYPGYFLNSDGMFSSLKRIQDSYYYQQFSYVIRSEESRNRYENIVKNVVHPAGLIFFSEVISESKLDVSAEIPPGPDGEIATPTEIFTDLRLDYNEFGRDILEYVFVDSSSDANEQADVEIFTEDVLYGDKNVPLGPTWADWDKWKMDYRPTPVFGKPDDEIVQAAHVKTIIKVPHPVTGVLVDKTVIQTGTANYYELYANTPLKVFADVLLKTIHEQEMSPVSDLPETAVEQFITQKYANQAAFPSVGAAKHLYVDLSANKTYMWSAVGSTPSYFALP